MTRHLLIGSGPASVAAAETIRGLDPSADIEMVSREAEGYYSRPGLAYHLAKEVPEGALFPFGGADLGALGVWPVHGYASRLDTAEKRLTLSDGRDLTYDRLLVATGSQAVPLRVPGADLDGVVKLDDLADARGMIHRGRRGRRAVVVGGGITALEIVEGLCARDVDVHYLMRRDRYWSNVLSPSESAIVQDGLRARGVEIHHFTELAAVLGRGGRVSGVETTDGRRLPCDMVAVAIGVLPEVSLARAAGIACGRGVLCDAYLRSSVPDVFAAGDVAEVAGPDGTTTLEVLWDSAVRKGRTAGRNMVRGPESPYDPGVPLNVTRLAGFRITIIGTVGNGADADLAGGIVRGDSETWRRMGAVQTAEWEDAETHVRLALQPPLIAGAVVMGDQALSFPLQELIAARADIGDAARRLAEPAAPVADVIREAHEEWRSRVPARS